MWRHGQRRYHILSPTFFLSIKYIVLEVVIFVQVALIKHCICRKLLEIHYAILLEQNKVLSICGSPGSRAAEEKQFFDSHLAPFYRIEQVSILLFIKSYFFMASMFIIATIPAPHLGKQPSTITEDNIQILFEIQKLDRLVVGTANMAAAAAAFKRTWFNFLIRRSLLKAQSHFPVLRLTVNFKALLEISIAGQQNPVSVIIQVLDINHSNVIKTKSPHNLELQLFAAEAKFDAKSDSRFGWRQSQLQSLKAFKIPLFSSKNDIFNHFN
ncbi:hypothetical protein G4B88_021572, partial [Cannabis sativa]